MQKKLNLLAPVGQTGYGVTGFNVLKALDSLGWEIALIPKGPHGRTNPKEVALINKATELGKMFFHDAPCLNIWHQFELSHSVGRGKYFAWPIFELDKFNILERHHLEYPDTLIVCSEWAKNVVVSETSRTRENTSVIPLGVDNAVFNAKNLTPKDPDAPYIFLNVGKWEVRKGHDILWDMFNEAFGPADPVELWLMPHNPFISQEDHKAWSMLYMDSPMGRAGKIRILPWMKDHEDVMRIMSNANCGIFPSRGEGWNLELLEMISLGKPVITTNYSAHTEFCNGKNSSLIKIDNLEPAYDGQWFFGQGNWAAITSDVKDQFINAMRYNVEQQIDANDEGILTGKNFSWMNSAVKLEQILLDIS